MTCVTGKLINSGTVFVLMSVLRSACDGQKAYDMHYFCFDGAQTSPIIHSVFVSGSSKGVNDTKVLKANKVHNVKIKEKMVTKLYFLKAVGALLAVDKHFVFTLLLH